MKRSLQLTPQALSLLLTVLLIHSVWRQSGAIVVVMVEAGLVGALVANAVWAAVVTARVQVSVLACPTEATVGEPVACELDVGGTHTPVEVRMISSSEPRWFRVDPPARGVLAATAGSRGVATAAVFEVTTSAPLGLIGFTRRFLAPLPLPLYIAPRPEVVPEARFPRHERASLMDEVVRGTRPYLSGDPMRLVHWPSTARTGTLTVRELEPPAAGAVVVAVALEGDRAAADAAAGRAAWTASEALRRGHRVTLATVEDGVTVIAPVVTVVSVARRLAAATDGTPVLEPAGQPTIWITSWGDSWP
ncbi:MAG: DUF58 domain-containing protein [Acidimicrobiia bacterium]